MKYAGSYLVRGSVQAADSLVSGLEREKIIRRGSPDLFFRIYRSFGVDDAEDVRHRARAKPVDAPQRVFVLVVPSMTNEAQNALLKTLEEPAADSIFFIVAPSPETFLPTIRSRSQTLDIGNEAEEATALDIGDFLRADPEKRLLMLKPLYEHDDEGRDTGSVIGFLHALERQYAAKKRTPETDEGIHAIYRARKYAADKGSLLKSLLEQVALLAPKL